MRVLLLPLIAVAAGLLSFSSPCCLPLLPTYVSFMTGATGTSSPGAPRNRHTIRIAWSFVAGFAIVFTLLGGLAGLLGTAIVHHLPTLTRASGLLVVTLGFAALGIIRVPPLGREARLVKMHRIGHGKGSAVVLGAAFAAGWSPCIGPILATILTTAATTRTVGWGAVLLALYSVGLGLPFVAVATGVDRMQQELRWLRRHGQAIERLSGILLVAIGLLMVSGRWLALLRPLQRSLARYGWPPI